MAQQYRNLTLLHSNDIHGDFLGENVDSEELGGLAMLSGYVMEERAKNPYTLYCIAGDMLQGSLIDTEFKGLSTVEIMNMVSPDIACLGNHEIDYGLAHLLFLERCARFPIVCANLFIKTPYTRLFTSHRILKVNGMRILFIGIITEEVLSSIRMDNLLSTLIDVENAAQEVGRICNSYRLPDIDLTVLLTHIGFEEDKQLASLLDPAWGVDIIIGGHSHSVIDAPAVINDILVATAGHGTSQIGRFDLVVDTESNSIYNYKWEFVTINSTHCSPDTNLRETILRYKKAVDEKYEFVLCKFRQELTHPDRYQETALGNLLSDALKDRLGIDVMMLGSGSIRKEHVGPVLTRAALMETMPYDDKVLSLKVSGAQLRHMLAYMLREEVLDGGHGEFYQLSHGLSIGYDRKSQSFYRFELNGEPIDDETVLSIGLQDYHYKSFAEFFNLPREELVDGRGMVLTTSLRDVLEEYFSTTLLPDARVEGRLMIT